VRRIALRVGNGQCEVCVKRTVRQGWHQRVTRTTHCKMLHRWEKDDAKVSEQRAYESERTIISRTRTKENDNSARTTCAREREENAYERELIISRDFKR